MDDLDAVLASLEHTETALRQPARVHDPLTQTITGLDTDFPTELDADFAAELDALSMPHNQTPSIELEVGTQQIEALEGMPGQTVSTLGALTEDQKGKIDTLFLEYKSEYNFAYGSYAGFVQLKQSLEKDLKNGNVIQKDWIQNFTSSYQDTKNRFEKARELLRKVKWSVKKGQKTSDEDNQIRKEIERRKEAEFSNTKAKLTEVQDDYNTLLPVLQKTLPTQNNSQQATKDEGQYDHEESEKIYKNMKVELDALNDKNNRVEELIKTVDNFIQSEKKRGVFQSNIRTTEADRLYQNLMEAFLDISLQRSKTQKYMSNWQNHVLKNVPTDHPDSKLLTSYKIFEKNYVDHELLIEGYIDERISELHQICTLKYIKTIPKFEATHGLSFTITRDHQKYKQPEFKTINTHITTTTFATKLTLFTQNFLALVYPPIPTLPWSRISTYTTMPTQKHKNAVHNTALAALCKRVAHITAVADRHPLLAALRFALEITPKSPLLIHALKSTPTILASRAAAEPHTNIVSIRACLAEDKLNRLIRLADADLNRIRIEKQEMLNQPRQSKGNKIPRSIYTKQSRGKSHKHNHTHAYQSKNDERQNKEHDDNASQSSKKSNQTTSSWRSWNPLNIFNQADDMVKSYQDRDIRNTNV